MMRFIARVGAALLAAAPLGAQARQLPNGMKPYVTVNEPVVALTNARVVDGTGASVKDGQTIVIRGEKIAAVGPASAVTVPAGARTIDLAGKTVIPGIVGLHDHMYYGGMKFMGVSYPRLFLSAGVTTIRTTGSVDAYQELNLKRLSDSMLIAAPTIVVGTNDVAMRTITELQRRRYLGYRLIGVIDPHGRVLGTGFAARGQDNPAGKRPAARLRFSSVRRTEV